MTAHQGFNCIAGLIVGGLASRSFPQTGTPGRHSGHGRGKNDRALTPHACVAVPRLIMRA